MRLLWLTHFVPYPPIGHGALQRTHHLLKEACKQHEIHVVALSPPSPFISSRTMPQAVAALSAMATSIEVFPVADLHGARRALCAAASCLQSRSFWERWYWSRPMHQHVRRVARAASFDLVHIDTIFLAGYLDAVGGTPSVLNHHNVESHLLASRAGAQRTSWGRAYFERQARNVVALEQAVVPRVAGNIVVSHLDDVRLREIAPAARIATVPNGVDVDFFRPSGSVAPETGSFVFVGGMDWFPNRDAMEFFVTEIWPALVSDNPQRTMTVVGRNPPRVLLNDPDSRLRALGFVEDIRPHIEAASIYVCPIRIGGGTRLKILDALAMARPVVSTNVGVEGLGLVEGIHYLRANSPAQFVNQIGRLESDTALRKQLGEAGRAFVVDRYSWRGVAQHLEKAYEDATRAA